MRGRTRAAPMYTREDLVAALQRLGLAKGDMVLVRAASWALGRVEQEGSLALLQALVDVVGREGTVVGLAFNKAFLLPGRHRDYVVTSQTRPVTGDLAWQMVKWPGALRSQHPTNSFVAIGRLAREVVAGHDENATCFHPVEKVLEHDGKMILVGCVRWSPGFATVHLAQEKAGLATRSILSGRQGVYYRSDGDVRLFRRSHIPGCSRGFYKLYGYYVRAGKLHTGFVGDAYSIAIRARDAFAIDNSILARDPRAVLCDNPKCFSCRGTRLYSLRGMPRFYLSSLPRILRHIRTGLLRPSPR